jgi:hypothetical protein
MGDTLTHLESTASVQGLFSEIGCTLTPGGVFVATFRDYASKTLEGLDRFIPVRRTTLASSRVSSSTAQRR